MRIGFMVFLFMLGLAPSFAQENAPLQRQVPRDIIDAVGDRLRDRLRLPREDDTPDAGLIDFDTIGSPSTGASVSVALTTQYRESHGVTFGKGASVHFCTDSYNEFSQSQCPYPQAASGKWAALHDVNDGGRAMVVNFAAGISSVKMKINPTGGRLDEEFIAQINGFDSQGNRIATNSLRFPWFQDAFSWPTEISVTGRGVMTRITVELRRVAANNQPVRFLIDDLSFERGPIAPPVAAALNALDGPPQVGAGVIVQSPRRGGVQSGLQVYPAATRKRVAIDWDAVDAALADQQTLGLRAVTPPAAGQQYIDRAELPVLLPISADGNVLHVFGDRDSVNTVYYRDGRGYAVNGSRLLTVLKPAAGSPGVRSAISFSGSEDDLTASFSLYGASYTLTQHCLEVGLSADAACHDRDMLGKAAEELVVVVGTAGRARP